MMDYVTSVKVKFLGEEKWSWVNFKRVGDGSIVSSDDRLTAKWTEPGTPLRFQANAELVVENQVLQIFASPRA